MNIVEQHVRAVKREIEEGRMVPTKTIGIDTINLDNFQFKIKEGLTNVAELVETKEFIDQALDGIAYAIKIFIDYHPDSTERVWDTLEKCPENKTYNIGLDLHSFIEVKSNKQCEEMGFMMADNYKLAKKALRAYKKTGNDIKGIDDVSYRDTAMWEFKSKAKAKKFAKFINKKYIKPVIDKKLEFYSIEKVNFGEEQITFDYKD